MNTNSDYISDKNAEETVTVVARLKWFNATKGFGFLVPLDNPVDAFLHITTLQQAGLMALGEGALLRCSILDGPKGYMVIKIIEVIEQGSLDSPESNSTGESARTMCGVVKWYKPEKGFGFIIPDDGKKDVFVHKTCLDREGVSGLSPGQKVEIEVQDVEKGREAFKIRLLDTPQDIGNNFKLP